MSETDESNVEVVGGATHTLGSTFGVSMSIGAHAAECTLLAEGCRQRLQLTTGSGTVPLLLIHPPAPGVLLITGNHGPDRPRNRTQPRPTAFHATDDCVSPVSGFRRGPSRTAQQRAWAEPASRRTDRAMPGRHLEFSQTTFQKLEITQ